MSALEAEVKEIFSPEGLLSKLDNYEFRPQQLDMAVSIAHFLENNSHNIIEAPTGIGKSYAYLVPSIIFSKKENRKAIVSTCTIHLQEQLIKKDIPALKSLLPYEFSAEILKGRQNYLCTRRLNNAMISKNSLFGSEEQRTLEKVYEFVQKHEKGTRQDIPFKVNEDLWSEIFAEEGICTSKSCGREGSGCYYQQAKQKIKDADIVILNHYLFFTLLGFYERNSPGFLYTDDFAVFDEAHTVEEIASENVSPRTSKEQVRFWLNKLYNPRSRKGFLQKYNSEPLIKIVTELHRMNEDFFGMLGSFVFERHRKESKKDVMRIRSPIDFKHEFSSMVLDLTVELKKFTERARSDDDENEIGNYFTKFNRIRNHIISFIDQKLEEHVYWVEFSGSKRTNINLCMAPIDMAEYFRDNIFTDNRLCIMTSATLAESKSMDFFKNSVGAGDVSSLILDSPFDLVRQMKVRISSSMPEPKAREQETLKNIQEDSNYEKALFEKIPEYIHLTGGGALILFTNIRTLGKAFISLTRSLEGSGIRILFQSSGMPKNLLLDEFRKDKNSVLLGVDSFWTGIDVPGESLRNVIITRLPFDVPDHPVIEAKLELIQARGGNPFIDYSLPSAVLRFRQGIGRLIRNHTDTGVVCILDSRIIKKTYGKRFLDSLTECDIIVDDM